VGSERKNRPAKLLVDEESIKPRCPIWPLDLEVFGQLAVKMGCLIGLVLHTPRTPIFRRVEVIDFVVGSSFEVGDENRDTVDDRIDEVAGCAFERRFAWAKVSSANRAYEHLADTSYRKTQMADVGWV
jgi:hypothetical protein